MMKRVWLMMLLICLLLAGCGMEVKDEQAIMEDILAEDVILKDYRPQIIWMEIIQRQTNKDDKTDRVFVQLEGRVEAESFTCQYALCYEYFDQGGWILQDIQPYMQEEWTIHCPDEKQLRSDLTKPMALDLPGLKVQEIEWSHAYHSPDLTDCTVYATVHGVNEYAKGVFSVRANYVLNSFGWWYQDSYIDYENSVVTPIAGVAEDAVLGDAYVFCDYGGNYTVTDRRDDFTWGSQVWYLQNREPGEYLDVIHDVQIAYYFDTEQLCWVLESADTLNTEYQWNIAGSWRSAGTANGVYGDYDYDLTMDITDLGGGQFQVDYDFCGAYGQEAQPDGSRIIPDYSGTIYADASLTELRGDNFWYGGTPENQYMMELDPHDFFGKLFVSSEDGIYLYRSGAGSRHFERQ